MKLSHLSQQDFHPGFAASLPATNALLSDGGLVFHPAVSRVFLHGSRGIAGGCRPDSDVDLSLVVDALQCNREELGALLEEVIDTTLIKWKGAVDLDLAAIAIMRGGYGTGWCRVFGERRSRIDSDPDSDTDPDKRR